MQSKINHIIKLKREYFNCLDDKAKYVARKLIEKKPATRVLLRYISQLYNAANTEKMFSDNDFSSAYHQPITSDLEFLIARTFYQYSKKKNLGWVVALRRQKKDAKSNKMVTPDIRIESGGSILAIVEIKAKAGWMQPFFSDDRMKIDIGKGLNPKEQIKKTREQLKKYTSLDKCGKDKVFLLLPSFIHVNRKKYKKTSDDYRDTFARNSTLSKRNLILLSNNTSLNLASISAETRMMATDNFENFVYGLG